MSELELQSRQEKLIEVMQPLIKENGWRFLDFCDELEGGFTDTINIYPLGFRANRADLKTAFDSIGRSAKPEKEPETDGLDPNSIPSLREDHDWILYPDHPGYAINNNREVKDVIGGKGRKLGCVLRLTHMWKKTRKGTYYNAAYYRLLVDGKRKCLNHSQVLIDYRRAKGGRNNVN